MPQVCSLESNEMFIKIGYYYSSMKTTIHKLIRYPVIIKQFFEYPQRKFTPLELSKLTKIPYSTTWRYIHDLESAGLINIEKIGEYNICTLNKSSSLIPQLKRFMQLKMSPHWLAIEEFVKNVKILKVKKIILFGSVAKGKETLRSDIDIAVIVKSRNKSLENKIIKITHKILDKMRMRIIPLVMTEHEMEKNKRFAQELKKGEMLYERSKRG